MPSPALTRHRHRWQVQDPNAFLPRTTRLLLEALVGQLLQGVGLRVRTCHADLPTCLVERRANVPPTEPAAYGLDSNSWCPLK